MSGNQFGDAAAQALVQIIMNCRQLTTLSLDSCELTQNALAIIVGRISQVTTPLAGISLQKNLINNLGIVTLAQAVSSGQLTSLNLSQNLITSEGIT